MILECENSKRDKTNKLQNQQVIFTPKKFITTISLIHFALFMGQVLFGAAVLFLKQEELYFNLEAGDDVLFYVAPFMVIVGLLVGNFLYRNMIEKLFDKSSLKEKLLGFQTAATIKLALLEVPVLFTIATLLLTANLYYLSIAAFVLVYFALQRPTKEKCISELDLSEAHQRVFTQEKELIVD